MIVYLANIAYFSLAMFLLALPLWYVAYLAKVTGNVLAWGGFLAVIIAVFSSLTIIVGPVFLIAWIAGWLLAMIYRYYSQRSKAGIVPAVKTPKSIAKKKIIRRTVF